MMIPDDSGTHATLADSEDTTDSQALPRGSNLGRYVIIEPIGSGGMGTVYRAYDPQLNRGVALKILSVKHADIQAAERAKARLIREAQALAQLSHPNVVAVHDAGALGDDVFIAMELVEGKTLDEFMRQEKRSVKDILEMMIAAGRGLSAAHKAGLIHRDFKPGNVMVGDDERVRVLDFGLACAAEKQGSIENGPEVSEKDEQSQDIKNSFDPNQISSESSPNLLQSPLTNAGGVLGTPLYMAPEQHLGLKTDERTDQFGFCVVLYEALYGRRPFVASSLEELKTEVIRQRISIPPTNKDVPEWLWQIIRKGLNGKPEDRYPTIDSLLEELDKDPEEVRQQKKLARRRRLLFISLITLTITLPVGVWYGLRYRTFQLCKDIGGKFGGVWDEQTKVSLQRAFLGTKESYAQSTWERVEKNFDNFLVEWAQMRSDVCEDRLIRGTQSEKFFDMRMGCLEKRVRDLSALVKVFSEADSGVVKKAVQASMSLTGISICADEEALRAPYPPPETREAKAAVASIREQLAEVEAMSKTGKIREGLDLAKRLEAEAREVNYQPVQAEVLYWLGDLLEKVGEYKKAETTLHDAARAAGRIGDAIIASKTMAKLVLVGYEQDRQEAGLSFGRAAEVFLDFAKEHGYVRANLFNNLGVVYWNQGLSDKALDYFQRSLAIRKKVLGTAHPDVAQSLNNIGLVFKQQGEYNKALEQYQTSLEIAEKTLGSLHPNIANPLNNIAGVFAKQGDYDKALDYCHKAVEITEKSLGPNHPSVADSMTNMGGLFYNLGKKDKALECYRRALFIDEKTRGPENPLLVWSLGAIGNVFLDKGMPKEALGSLERVASICGKKKCKLKPHGLGLFGLARALITTGGDKIRAIKHAKQAREIFEKAPNAFGKELEKVDEWLAKHETGTRKANRISKAKR